MSKSKIINTKPSELKGLNFTWTEIPELTEVLADANRHYGFDLSDEDILITKNILKNVPDQPDSFRPISLFVWPNGKFDDNIQKIFQWAADRAMECEGIDINCSLLADLVDGKMHICNSLFDYDNQRATVRIDTVDLKNRRIEYPFGDSVVSAPLGIELWSFIALHPQCLKLLNGKGIGNLEIPGLRFAFPNSQLYINPIFSVKAKKMVFFGSTPNN